MGVKATVLHIEFDNYILLIHIPIANELRPLAIQEVAVQGHHHYKRSCQGHLLTSQWQWDLPCGKAWADCSQTTWQVCWFEMVGLKINRFTPMGKYRQWYWHQLTHWPLGNLEAILKLQFSISFYWLVSSHCLMIMPWDECEGTSPMISQQWFR